MCYNFLPLSIKAATKCDSITLTPGPWLGLPAVPAVTLYRHEDPALVSWTVILNTNHHFTAHHMEMQSKDMTALCAKT